MTQFYLCHKNFGKVEKMNLFMIWFRGLLTKSFFLFYSEKLDKLKRIHNRAKNMLQGTVNSAYLNSIPSMIEALEEVELM